MSNLNTIHRSRDLWWDLLGLRAEFGPAAQVLRTNRPHGFISEETGADAPLTLNQVVDLIQAAEQEAELQAQHAAVERRVADVAEFESAFLIPGADAAVEHGRWVGFTRGEATAWCWNLFQYEPHGFVHPGSQVRAEALVKLRAGGLPEVFGYPERARELAERSLTPRQYREHREALGSRMFDPADVRRG